MSRLKITPLLLLPFALLLALPSCKKNKYGSLQHRIRYSTDRNVFRKTQGNDSTYQQYGTYITSLTPFRFTAKLNMMHYTDRWNWDDPAFHGVGYVSAKDSSEVSLYADFSGNRETSLKATLGSRDLIESDEGSAALFRQKEVDMIYFSLNIFYFYQELELPAQYKDVNLTQFNQYYEEFIAWGYGGSNYICDTMKNGTRLRSRNAPFTSRIFDGHYLTTFVFGNTDSSFVYNRNREVIEPSENFPYPTSGFNRAMVVRSHRFTPVKLIMPDAGETATLFSTMVFDTENLIQLYAGADNTPYTADDIMVYAPNFWERIKVKLEMR